jgi:RNA-directed DNA polymerase
MATYYPSVPFERYADDVIVHCRTEWQAKAIRKAIAKRLLDCGLELHPEKTRIIYCKDDLRKGRHTDEKFDFLGYEFRPRKSINRNGKVFTNFSPAVSTTAAKSMRAIIRNWRLRQCSHQSLEDLSRLYNPILRGWFQYYGRYYRTGLYSVIRQLDQELVNWARQKYKKLRNHVRRARRWVAAVSRRSPHLFAPWAKMRGGSLMGAV